jgi:hypothetical protein
MKILRNLLLISSGITILLGIFVAPEHPHFFWEKIPGFDAVFGFIGCTLIILGSKALGHGWLQKKEDYYD